MHVNGKKMFFEVVIEKEFFVHILNTNFCIKNNNTMACLHAKPSRKVFIVWWEVREQHIILHAKEKLNLVFVPNTSSGRFYHIKIDSNTEQYIILHAKEKLYLNLVFRRIHITYTMSYSDSFWAQDKHIIFFCKVNFSGYEKRP